LVPGGVAEAGTGAPSSQRLVLVGVDIGFGAFQIENEF
jgi:hypothetical protein